MVKFNLLLGITKEKEIAFANIEIRNVIIYKDGQRIDTGKREFSASFDTVAPFEVEETDGIEYMQQYIDDCLTDGDKYELCKRFDVAPSDLAEAKASKEYIFDNADTKDCSFYSNRIYVDGLEYAFESMAGGQHDVRENGGMLELAISQADFDFIMEMWDNNHLKVVTPELETEITERLHALELEATEEEEKIAELIRTYILEI